MVRFYGFISSEPRAVRPLIDTVNECDSHPCANGATCLDRGFGFECVCAFGYTGAQCEGKCTNMCRTNS